MSIRAKQIASLLNDAKTDTERLWLAKAFNKDITVYCDIDVTFLRLKGEREFSIYLDNYFGRNNGVFTLLKMLGIKAEMA